MPIEYVISAPRTLTYRSYNEPALKPDEVRVKTVISGIKQGTELALYSGGTPFREASFDLEQRVFMPRAEAAPFYPVALGSWVVGEVIEIGAAVTGFKPGDRVHGSMLHKPTNVKPARELFALGDLQAETALFTDPAFFALAAVHDAGIKLGDSIAVFGCGILGLLAQQLARLQGALTVIAVDAMEQRLTLAQTLGATHTLNARNLDVGLEIKRLIPKGVDAVVEFSGSYAGLQAAIRSIHQGGTVACAGYYRPGQSGLELGAEWHHNRPQLVSSMPVWGNPLRCAPMWDLQRLRITAIALLGAGRLQVAPLITHHFAYADAAEAYALLERAPESTMKIVLTY